MKTDVNNLIAAYGRRALHATAVLSLLAIAAAGHAQDGAQSKPDTKGQTSGSSQKKSDKTPDKTDKKAKTTRATGTPLRVVPVPRQTGGADGSTSGAGAASQNTGGAAAQTPGGGRNTGGGLPGGTGQFPGGGRGGFDPNNLPQGFDPSRFQGGAGGRRNPFGGRGAGTTFAFDYHNTDIANVLRFYSMMSGLTITTDPGLTGPVTIISPRQVTLDEAFKILQSVLSVRGYTAQQHGNVLAIVPFDVSIRQSPLIGGADDNTNTIDPRNQVMTQVIPLENVDAEAMAKDLQPLINKSASLIGSAGTNSLILTDTSDNVKRFIELVNALDKTSSHTELKVYPLRHAEAASVAQTIGDLFKQITSRGKSGAPPQPGQPGFQPPQPGQPQGAAGGGARPAVVAVADSRTNSVIVVASPDNQEQIAREIINRLDDDDSATLDTKIIKIKYSNANDVANMVNTVLSNMHGAAATSSGGRGFGGFNPFGFGGGGNNNQQTVESTDPFGKVVADARTNSVFVTASAERMTKIQELIKQIDVEVPVETTTFVIPLKNAQASDVAYALGQAFSTGNSNQGGNTYYNFGGGNNSRGNGTQRQQTNRRLGSSSSNTQGFGRAVQGRSAPPPPNAPDGSGGGDNFTQGNGGSAIPQGIPGVMTDQGFVPSNTADIQAAQEAGKNGDQTRQFYGGGGFFGGQRRGVGQSNQPQYGRGSTGAYANLLQLQNNVFVTPSPDGDSIIVTTTPDNYQALKKLVDQLDIVPRQVMVEVIVAEVTLDTDQKFGFNLAGMIHNIFDQHNILQGQISVPANGFSTNTALDPTQAGEQFVLSGTNFTNIIQALNSDNKVKVLSTPRVFTSNNQQATIDITTNIPYITGQTSNGFVSTNISSTVEYLQVGLMLNVTPRITADGKVTIDLVQEASDLIQFDQLNTGTGVVRAPRYNDRYADTSVTIQDGQTVVVGGLIRDSENLTVSKVPLLGDIPLVGQFFRSREKARNKVELMIFVTPHVVETTKAAHEMTIKTGEPVIRQLPNLIKQQPNLDLQNGDNPVPGKADKSDKSDSLKKSKAEPQTPKGGTSNP